MSMPNGTLEDWSIVNGSLWGKIFGDTTGKFQDGEVIITSKLKSLDFLSSRAYTNNSCYILGKERLNDKTIYSKSGSGRD